MNFRSCLNPKPLKSWWSLSLALCLSLTTFKVTKAQELNCTVKVVAQKLQTTEPRVFQTLQTALTEFMNNRRWTGDTYAPNERIECSMVINITEEKAANRFIAQATVQANRPVYRSSYNSTMLNLVDQDVAFEYVEYQPFEFNESAGGNNNLTNIMAYYAYLILGLDYDSFSPRGGAPYFAKAQNIINLNSNGSEAGWKALEKTKNRYWMIENLTNPKYDAFHTAWHKYHRDGLDMMYDDSDKGRKAVTEAINLINGIQSENPGIMLMQQFFSAKSEELTNIYSGAVAGEKNNMVQLLSKMDPINTGRYQKILKSNDALNAGGK